MEYRLWALEVGNWPVAGFFNCHPLYKIRQLGCDPPESLTFLRSLDIKLVHVCTHTYAHYVGL
jgi:hypothetical protein